MLSDIDDVVKRIGVHLDDPTNSVYDLNYLLPFIDQSYDEMDVQLEKLGMQYIEGIAVFPVDVGVSDLSALLQDGQPLASMKTPKSVDWKLPSQADNFYSPADLVNELEDVPMGTVGAFQWRNANGAIQITPSSQPIVLRVYFDQISTDLYDPAQNVIRGTAHILALEVTAAVCATAGDLKMRVPYFEKRAKKAWANFTAVLVGNRQSQSNVNPRLHGRVSRFRPTMNGRPLG